MAAQVILETCPINNLIYPKPLPRTRVHVQITTGFRPLHGDNRQLKQELSDTPLQRKVSA